MTLYILLPVHNRAAVSLQFVDALVKQSFGRFHLVLIDDGCTDGTVEGVQRRLTANRLTVLRGDGQLWWGGALQLGFDHLSGLTLGRDDAVLITNDDVVIPVDFLACGLAVLAAHPDAAIQAVGVDRASGTVDRGAIADLTRLRFREALPHEAPNCLSTRGLLMSAPTFLQSGGFRPRWLPHYLSDYEFTLRLRRRGVALVVDERYTAQVDLALTGLNQPRTQSARQLWRDSMSNRAKFNPKHWSAFALMVCPSWIAPLHVIRIWGGFARSCLRAALSRPAEVHE